MNGRRFAVWTAVGTAGLVLALILAGSAHGLALLAYVLFLGALGLAVLAGRLREELGPAPPFEWLIASPARAVEPIEQLETLSRTLSAAGWNQTELHHRLRPPVREIVAARLSRRYGIDLNSEPERARKLLGDGRAWDLARPDRERPEDRYARGWSRRELAELLDELEAI
jgi:hypothetical protein